MVIMDIGEAAQPEPGSSIESRRGGANTAFARDLRDLRRVDH